jgi:heterodisulfide reductase subunit B
MEYAYYPGCSLETAGKPYDLSVREIFKKLDVGLREIEDWNCCGATMYMSINKMVGYAVAARNLAIAQDMGLEVCAPCNSCYTILRKTNRHMVWDPEAGDQINEALAAAGLSYTKPVEIRHPLDILVNDVKLDKVIDRAKFSLSGLKIAPYYGCQLVRPVFHFDDLEEPQTMDRLFEALGAEAVDYPDKVRCCGGMLMTTFEEVALRLNNDLLIHAEDAGADVIATACPLCQINLECYQDQINKKFNTSHKMPILYFSQLVGLALGIDEHKLGMDTMLSDLPNIRLTPKVEKKAV